MRIAAFPPQSAFLAALASAWLAAPGDAAEGLLILPSRRAARAAAGAFLAANGGRPLLLPRIIALGALDEAGLALQAALDLPPSVPALTRQAILAKLTLARDGANGAPTKLHTAWALAADLAALLDEAGEAEISLHTALREVVPAELAAHWQTTLEFLDIVTDAWPKILGGMGMLDPSVRQARLADAQGRFWSANPPAGKIWLVASQAAPALARLAKTIATLPLGAVILPGYDTNLDEAAWQALGDSHAQSGIARLLTALGAGRDDVEIWPAAGAVPAARAALLSRALLPAAALDRWQTIGPLPDTAGLSRLAARDEAEEAVAIAMALREAIEIPGRSAALVTPDRELARRVAAILPRFGILADDSAGEPLGDTPPAILLRLIARAAAAQFAPVPLLALLKHPLSAGGEPPEVFRAHARLLERLALRGPRPSPGFDGLKFRLGQRRDAAAAQDFLARLEARLKPVTGLPQMIPAADAIRAVIEAAEALAATEAEPGAARLWAREAGAALSERLLAMLEAARTLPEAASADLPELIDALLAGGVVRKPRTRDGHPRIAIWGVQEAALQTVDTVILAGLVETVWPATPDSGPWANRPMRKAAGLPSPDAKIGEAAHDFFSLCCRCGEVILAAPVRRGRAPAVPARWLTRLDALLAGAGAALPAHPAAAWARALDEPAERILRAKPYPRPPAEFRPRELSISDIATLIADPYAIYARKILGIGELAPLDEESDAAQFGNIAHAGLAAFFAQNPDVEAPDAARILTRDLHAAMRRERPREALDHWWDARLSRIAGWIVEAERARRLVHGAPVAIALEAAGRLPVGERFVLRGRADRIETRADGTVFIADYKTGTPPEPARVKDGSAPQLPLEAVMAEAGAFGADFCAPVTELAFWKLSGRHVSGEDRPLFAGKPEALREAIDDAAEQLPALVAKFADPATPYLARPHPSRGTYRDVYAGVSRSGEWGGPGDDDGA